MVFVTSMAAYGSEGDFSERMRLPSHTGQL